jgi:hypothetical protein
MKNTWAKNLKRKDGPNDLEHQVMSSVSRRNLSIVSQVGYETERLNYVLSQTYKPDIIVTFKDGRKLFIECKGWFRPEDRTKMAAVKLANPELDIRFVFPRNNRLNKNTETLYSDWCEKHNYPYHIGVEVPKAWLK